MVTTDNADSTLCVVREPIFDRQDQVFGYQLRHRDDGGAIGDAHVGGGSSARALTNVLLTFGRGELTGNRPAFLRFSRELILNGAATLASPASLVVELADDILVDEELVSACANLHDRGYALGLEHFVWDVQNEVLLPYVKFVTVNVLETRMDDLARLSARIRPFGINVIGKHVDSPDLALAARECGCLLVQGFYFCQPTTLRGAPLPPFHLAHLQLLGTLSREDLSTQQLEDVIKSDSALSLRLLRSINSAAYGVRREVTSIQQALVLLGRDQIRKWAAVWTLAGMPTTGAREIMIIALLRARCCELVGDAMEGSRGAEFFLLGLCSLMDVITGRSIAMALAELPLSRLISDALLGEPNDARATLDAVIDHERGDWDGAASRLAALGLPFEVLPSAYRDALIWARGLSHLE
jgi:EAL and modified HD-GYP domain-containing signal transduction protein